MDRNETEMNLHAKKLINHARTMKKWELIEEAVHSHSRLLKELKKEEPEIEVIDNYKAHIAVIEQVLSEKMTEAGHIKARAYKELYKEITGLFHFLFAVNEPAALQLYGIVSPVKQEVANDPAIPPPVSRRKPKNKRVVRRS